MVIILATFAIVSTVGLVLCTAGFFNSVIEFYLTEEIV